MTDYNVTHYREWHKVKIRYYCGENISIRRAAAKRFQDHFVKKHVIMTQLTEENNLDYYYIFFKYKEQALMFKLICGEAVYV